MYDTSFKTRNTFHKQIQPVFKCINYLVTIKKWKIKRILLLFYIKNSDSVIRKYFKIYSGTMLKFQLTYLFFISEQLAPTQQLFRLFDEAYEAHLCIFDGAHSAYIQLLCTTKTTVYVKSNSNTRICLSIKYWKL